MTTPLPPLPERAFVNSGTLGLRATDYFTADQMRDYGEACAAAGAAAERERCAKLCEAKSANGNWRFDTRHECAAAIRSAEWRTTGDR